MKKKIYKIVIALAIPLTFYFSVSGFKETVSIKNPELNILNSPQAAIANEFITCVYNADYFGIHNTPAQWSITGNIPRYVNELNFNSIQIYGNYESQGGGFNDLLNSYNNGVDSLMDVLDTTGLKVLYGRGKITTLCWGQRLEYEAEGGNNGFSYLKRSEDAIPDSGRQVLHACTNETECPETDLSPRFLCDSIYENIQHSNIIDDDFSKTDARDWFLKPEMRIKQSDFNINDTRPVVAIVCKNFDGETSGAIGSKDSIIIRVNNFRDSLNGITYSGKYKHDYHFILGTDSLQISANLVDGLNKGRSDTLNNCKIDFKIYWYGLVDVWFDKLIVDDVMGNNLFHANPIIRNEFELKITDEINAFRSYDEHQSNYAYYMDEITYANIPCIKKVVDLMKSVDPDSRLSCATTNYLNTRGLRNDTLGNRVFLETINPELFTNDAHEIPGVFPENLTLTHSQYSAAAVSTSIENYQDELQDRFGDRFNNPGDPVHGTLVYQVDFARRQRDVHAPNAQLLIQPLNNSYFIKREGNSYWEGLREPTNEEIQAQAMLCIAHGANGICWLGYQSTITIRNPGTDVYFYGLLDTLNANGEAYPRTSNIFGQNKWAYTGNLNLKLKNWKPTLDKTVWQDGYSVHSEGAGHNYISNIISKKRDPNSSYPEDTTCAYCDASNERYWDMGFFDPDFTANPNDKSKYFMMVNRRCVPDTPTGPGDFRQLKIKFNPSQLTGFNNWKIIDLDTNNVVSTFDKNSTAYITMGEFKPGEGKLYKLAPVIQEGGTLVTDEDCGGFEFDCKGEVNNNGKSITISPGTTINFENTSARIVMNEGVFTTGVNTAEETTPIYFRGKNGNFWKGLSLNECGGVEMFTTYFENISPYPVDSTYAATMIDCEYINIGRCIFHADLDIKTGGILIYYTSELRTKEVFVNYNRFTMDAGDMPALSIMTAGYITFPLIIEGNEFESYSGNSSNAILLSGVAGGAIKENQIIGYKNGVILFWSVMDIYGNNIIGGDQDSKGVLCYASSYTNLSPNGFIYTGGLNTITCEGENSACIESDNSYLYLDYGFNTFDLKNYDPGNAFHITGTVHEDLIYEGALDEALNCFMVSEIETTAVHNVTWGFAEPVEFNFEPYYCGDQESESMIVYNLGNGNYDSLLMGSSGSGGGVSNYQLSIFNDQSQENAEIISAQNLVDSVSINIRKRDYEKVSEMCKELLDDYIDSIQSPVIVQKLYLAELRLDSTGNRVSNLKSYFEMLILNNPEKELLVKQAFYLIQKCKVALGLYESAMDGFEQIINQNPYSYEGLVASWDYAATSLLDSLHGSSGGIKDLEFGSEIDDDPKDKFDKKTFTMEDRKSIRTNVFNSYKTSRDKEAEKIKTLETKVAEGKSTKSEKNELQIKRILKEIVKPKEPADITEHIKNINNNIQVLFGSSSGNTNDKEIKSIIPTDYYISQNYPNPFNPVTKINFELPHEGKVKLIVYDLLGREILKLVNNELREAGRHMVEFNGHNLSSGVYFYRLEVNDFVQTRRMILVK